MKKNIGAKQTITTMIITDPYNLQRFLGAQENFYAQALKEIRNGRKTSHWIWFIFPQVRGPYQAPATKKWQCLAPN